MAYLLPDVEMTYVYGTSGTYAYRDVRWFVGIYNVYGEIEIPLDEFIELIGKVLEDVLDEESVREIVRKLGRKWGVDVR